MIMFFTGLDSSGSARQLRLARLAGSPPMTDDQCEVIRRLVGEYLPHFEAGEAPSMRQGSFFMRFIEQAAQDDILDEEYVMRLERLGGWDALKDLDLIGRAKIDDVRALLTAGFRSSEYFERDVSPDMVWRDYAQAGTFTAILRRFDRLEREVSANEQLVRAVIP